MRTVLVVQHQDDCPPAWFGTWIEEAGIGLDVRRPYRGEPLPADLSGHAGMLVLGGSMGADEYDRAPWLPAVKDLVRAAGPAPVLGICLGHQVIASALGGTVGRNERGTQRDILDVGWTDAAAADPVFGTRPPQAAHWNDDVVTTVPAGTVVLAEAPGGEVQVARFAENIWGIQSHPEIDQVVLADWIEDDRADGNHRDDGLDEFLERMADERDSLLATWKPVAVAFVGLCREQSKV